MELAVSSNGNLPPGKMIRVENNGSEILVANVNGQYYAIGNVCTHRGCKLSNGVLEGELVHCPCHGSTFNVKTGEVVKGPAKRPEPSFKTRAEGDKVMVSV